MNGVQFRVSDGRMVMVFEHGGIGAWDEESMRWVDAALPPSEADRLRELAADFWQADGDRVWLTEKGVQATDTPARLALKNALEATWHLADMANGGDDASVIASERLGEAIAALLVLSRRGGR